MQRKNLGRKALSWCLAGIMMLSIQGVFVPTEAAHAAETVEQTGETGKLPENPVHNCTGENDGSDATAWSYVYFGSYPQSEVTGDALTAAIAGADYSVTGDAWVNGTKYRRINGGYGDDGYRYFKWERIKWRVLNVDGSTMFVLADQGLDCVSYNNTDTSVAWEDCTIRKWLNGSFYNTAFSSREQGAIAEQTVENNITDKVSLLSCSDALNPEYGFCQYPYIASASRIMNPDDYALAKGSAHIDGVCWWWLRTQGSEDNLAANVSTSGRIDSGGVTVVYNNYTCVPALKINLSSDCWLTADDGTSGDGGSAGSDTDLNPKNPVHHCGTEGMDMTEWSYVYFGNYPQSEVTGDALTEAITAAAYDKNGDAWVNGTKYRRLDKAKTNHIGNFGDGEYRYFKWEPMKWRVLNVNDSTMLLAANQGLDAKRYNETDASVTWENCTLRDWLNDDFYGMAFDSRDQEAVVPKTIENGESPASDTTDKVFLLSYSEAGNPEYGFCDRYNENMGSRRMTSTDYAYVRGVNRDDRYADNCNWWLRTPGQDEGLGMSVYYTGILLGPGTDVSHGGYACVPVLQVKLSSDRWSVTIGGGNGSGSDAGDDQVSKGDGGTGSDKTANPKGTSLSGKLKAGKKKITVKWKKQTDISGYQIQYSTNKKFKKKATKLKTVKKPSAANVTIKKLKSGKKYYVRIRTYKTVNGKDYFSDWSKAKNVKTK